MENFDEIYKASKKNDEQKAAELVVELTRAGRQNELFKAAANAQFREALYKEFGIQFSASGNAPEAVLQPIQEQENDLDEITANWNKYRELRIG